MDTPIEKCLLRSSHFTECAVRRVIRAQRNG